MDSNPHHQTHIRHLENRIKQQDVRNATVNANSCQNLAAGNPASAGAVSPASTRYIPVLAHWLLLLDIRSFAARI